MLGFALTIGLLVFVVLKIQMMSLEVNWLRRYIVRLLTEQSQKSQPSASPQSEQQHVDTFDEQRPADDAVDQPDEEEDDIELNEESNGESDDENRIEEMSNE